MDLPLNIKINGLGEWSRSLNNAASAIGQMTSKAADQLKRLETRFNSLSKSVQGYAEVELASIKLGLAKVELSNMEANANAYIDDITIKKMEVEKYSVEYKQALLNENKAIKENIENIRALTVTYEKWLDMQNKEVIKNRKEPDLKEMWKQDTGGTSLEELDSLKRLLANEAKLRAIARSEEIISEEAFRAEMSVMDTTWSERNFQSLQEDIAARTERLNKLSSLGVMNETENIRQLSELSVAREQAAFMARAEIASQGDISDEQRRILSLKFEADYWNKRQEQLVEALNKGLITKEQYAKAEAEIDKRQANAKISLEKAIDAQRQARAQTAANTMLKIGNVGQEMARASTIKDMHERRRAQGEILKKEAIDAITSAETAGVAKIMSTHALMLPVGIAKAAVFIASMEVLKFGISQIGAAKGVIADRPMLTWIAEYEPELVVPKRLLDANRMPGGSPIDNIFNNQFSGPSQQFQLNTEVHIHNPIGDAGATLAHALESWEEQVGPALKRIIERNK